jgi:hypothetical protein
MALVSGDAGPGLGSGVVGAALAHPVSVTTVSQAIARRPARCAPQALPIGIGRR